MPYYTPYIKRYFNAGFRDIFRLRDDFNDPDIMQPSSSQLYEGKQGQGKTYSMNFHILKKVHPKYPNALIVANQVFTHMQGVSPAEWEARKHNFNTTTHYVLFNRYDELIHCLRHVRNGHFGVIFMIDEMHQYFHSHDSKDIPMWVVQVFSQQRKQYLLIVGTTQKYEEVAKVIRSRLDNVIICSKFWRLITHKAFDPDEIEMRFGNEQRKAKARGWAWLTREIEEIYDTREIIDSGRTLINGQDLNVNVHEKQELKPKRKRLFG